MALATWNKNGNSGANITADLFNEIKTNYKAMESAVAFSPTYAATVQTHAAGQVITATKLTELRTAINTLENKMSNNCNCSDCCQTCQGCQSCQACQTYSQCSYTCQTCQTCQTTTCQSTACQSHAQCTIGNCNCNCDCSS